ncbi:MAG: hypothetical protein IJP23_02660 [Oscillospiraceae bacterium]|nr:hypothetical protein [Oscillospiraceae bacterium]
MEFYMKFPRNKKEKALFILIVSVISVNIIAPLIACLEVGFSLQTWKSTLQVLPFIWIAVVIMVLLTGKPASKMSRLIVKQGDSFRACVLAELVCNVLLMSVVLTVVCTWIGTRSITVYPIKHFFNIWPRNYTVALAIEFLVAHPIARAVMNAMHRKADGKKAAVAGGEAGQWGENEA